jgi:hypothetical protein
MNRNNRVLMEQQVPRFTSDMIRVMDTMAHQLADFKLYFLPDDLKTIRDAALTVNIDFIKSILLKLSRYFAEIEKLYPDVGG